MNHGTPVSRKTIHALMLAVAALFLFTGAGASTLASPAKGKSQANRSDHARSGHTRSGHPRSGHRGHHSGNRHGGRRHYGGFRYYGIYHSPFYYSPYRYYGYPYYFHRYPYYYPSGFRYGRDSGAVDLNVKPKKTNVYVDGQLVGRTGKFDGFPDYLWLPQGTYEVVFHKEGFKTVSKDLTIYPGMVIDVNLTMAPGESDAPPKPENRTVKRREPRRLEETDDYAARVPPRRLEVPARERHRENETKEPFDLRGQPPILQLAISPEDASIYLDGRFLGNAEMLRDNHEGILLDVGDHKLDIMRPGYRSEAREFRIEAGEVVEISVELQQQ